MTASQHSPIGEIFLRANEKVIKLKVLDITLDMRVLVIFGLTKKSVLYSLRHKTATRSYAVHLLGFTELSRSNLRSFSCVNTDSLRLIIRSLLGFTVRWTVRAET